MCSLILSRREEIRSTNAPIVQKRRGVDEGDDDDDDDDDDDFDDDGDEVGEWDGGESDIPPARMQCLSNPSRDLALRAERNPFTTSTTCLT